MIASVVVPAHNEARGLSENLTALLDGLPYGALDVVVVCNGCTDDTAAVARSVPGVRVLEIAEASKARAVEVGNAAADASENLHSPRLYIDADVRLTGTDLLRLLDALDEDGVLAVAPERTVPLAESSWPVRAYYRVWQALPSVRSGLFGRGAFCLTAEGRARVAAAGTSLMNDDLVVSELFAPAERRVVADATVVVRPPRTLKDLVRRRIRVATGNAQADDHGARSGSTSLSDLLVLGLRKPAIGLRVPVFMTVTLVARMLSRRAVRTGDYTTWLRDESSRA
ncbi:glycosyltransferase [Nocardioides luteus]|uniref:glycosyltransferase n=1 Tax=Nocardioides luteus TaxID=1844 RepID=UPI0018CBEE53|nr:glycosyltransferase family 2 protein [Nocardioides luteus]MBG6098199.1 glycosyltransferase involved in cell wall biosynthesis [Nocardioides luteus]